MNYTIAKEHFDNHRYSEAFFIFKNIAEDQKNSLILRANALNMMGVIINGFSPDLDPEDKFGFKYFEMAVQLDPDNIGALLNIVEYYEDLPSPNSQLLTFKTACERLFGELSNDITSEQLSKVKTIYYRLFPVSESK